MILQIFRRAGAVVLMVGAVLVLAGGGGAVAAVGIARADDDAAPKLPRFVTLGKEEVFVRTGPSIQYPIRWVYKKRGLPVEIIREYDTWRQIRDYDGSSGWVHHAMLSGYRSVIITEKDGVTLVADPGPQAAPVVRLETGVVAGVERCEQEWCRLHISGFKGWAKRSALWGVYPSEEIN